MLRKLSLALAAVAVIGAAALAPGAASAKPFPILKGPHPHWHHGYLGLGLLAASIYDDSASDCYVVRRVVETYDGPRVRAVTICE